MRKKAKFLSRKKVYKGYCFDAVEDQVIWPNGKELSRSLIMHPGISVMVPILEVNRIILLKQYRYGAGRVLWEVPAGTISPGETPLQCAKREIVEETGFKASRWKKLTSCYTSPGYNTEVIHCFAASQLCESQASPEEDEVLESKVIAVQEVKNMIKEGKIQDAKSLVALFSYFKRL